MVDRPFADDRPIGPLMSINLDRQMGDKVQLGVSGTMMPNRSKSNLNLLFVLNDHVATLPKDVKGTLQDKIQERFIDNPRVKEKRSGMTSSAPFDEQAVIVKVSENSLPIQDAQLHQVADVIERHYDDFGVEVRTVFMDTE